MYNYLEFNLALEVSKVHPCPGAQHISNKMLLLFLLNTLKRPRHHLRLKIQRGHSPWAIGKHDIIWSFGCLQDYEVKPFRASVCPMTWFIELDLCKTQIRLIVILVTFNCQLSLHLLIAPLSSFTSVALTKWHFNSCIMHVIVCMLILISCYSLSARLWMVHDLILKCDLKQM